ncbi:MAG: PQQ-dependent sugar dehydrogenase, partial [Chloroflexi bacterium]|nr:PQQ-dependent sugar dehydrogenase [Chloroflexota bacterium]
MVARRAAVRSLSALGPPKEYRYCHDYVGVLPWAHKARFPAIPNDFGPTRAGAEVVASLPTGTIRTAIIRRTTVFNSRPTLLALATILCGLALPARAAVQQVLTGLDQPVRLVAPAGDTRLFVAERSGRIRVFNQNGVDLGTFLDISAQTTNEGERGVAGLAFAPDYATSRRFYLTFTDLQGDLNLARYSVTPGNPNVANAASQEIILEVDVPGQDHIGGHLEFAPDGTLYLGLGDGEFGGDPGNRAQDPQQLLGKILRLDVSGPTGYA